jgi:hypothetical protein
MTWYLKIDDLQNVIQGRSGPNVGTILLGVMPGLPVHSRTTESEIEYEGP